MGPLAWRIIGTGSAVAAGLLANKLVTEAWKRSGRDAQIDPADPDVPVGQALALAVLTGVAVAGARVLATRQAAAFYRRTTGHLPPGVEEA